MNRVALVTVLLLLTGLTVPGPASATPTVHVDRNQITVSGISAGAQMAHQLHIAFPEIFSGVGVLAGSPYGCAAGSLGVAMTRCMGKVDAVLPIGEFVENIRSAEKEGQVGEISLLRDDPVWIFHGSLDQIVAVELSDATMALYGEFIPSGNIRYVKDIAAAHTFPTRASGSACDIYESPFIGNCSFDAAGELLQHLYDDLDAPTGKIQTGLTETKLPGGVAAGLNDTAYLYIPAACTTGEQSCKAHLVLHGCAQSSAELGTDFIEQSGYLPWAAANNIVLAFPQVSPAPANPFSCWDWWGYTGTTYLGREGKQMKVLSDWMIGLSSP